MKVSIEVFATLRERLGWSSKTVEFDGDEITLDDLLRSVHDLHELLSAELGGGLNDLLDNYLVFINGIHAQFRGGLKAVLRDDDKVSIFPPAAGGYPDTYLTEKQLTVLRLRAQGLSVDEIARTLGVSRSNVYSILRSAKEVFEKSLRTVKTYNDFANNAKLLAPKGISLNELIRMLISEADNRNIKIPSPTYEVLIKLVRDAYECIDLRDSKILCDLILNLDGVEGVNVTKS